MDDVQLRTSGKPHPALLTLIILFIPIAIYFLTLHAFPKFQYKPEVYGEYYWWRAPWLLAHATCGILATFLGPLQFVPAFRNKYRRMHRNMGKLYLVSVGVAAFSAYYLAYTSAIANLYAAGLAFGATIWLVTGSMAYVHIRNGRTEMHRQMMVRNYVVTLFFILFFGIYDLLVMRGSDPYDGTMLSMLVWACLLIPLTLTEIALRRK